MTQIVRITLSAILAFIVTTAIVVSNATAQSGLRFNPGALAPGAPYTSPNSILNSMPASSTETTAQTEPPAAASAPHAESESKSTSANDPAEPTIHQGLSPEKANSGSGLNLRRGQASSPPSASAEISTNDQNPYLAPNPYTTPRSPGSGLRIR